MHTNTSSELPFVRLMARQMSSALRSKSREQEEEEEKEEEDEEEEQLCV